MRKFLLLFLLIVTIGCKNQRITADSPEKYHLENLALVIAEGDIEKVYPDAYPIEGTDEFEEGTVSKKYSILYPNTPEEILIVWKNERKKDFQEIRFSGTGRWKSEKGIAAGTTYKELLALNKAPLKVFGFGWDYSGAVDWNDGEFENSGLRVFMAPKNAPPNAFYGDHVLEASPEQLERLGLHVETIVLVHPKTINKE